MTNTWVFPQHKMFPLDQQYDARYIWNKKSIFVKKNYKSIWKITWKKTLTVCSTSCICCKEKIFFSLLQVQEVEQTVSVFFHVIFHMLLQKLFAKIDFFCFKWILHHIADLMGTFYDIWKHKNTSICCFEAL